MKKFLSLLLACVFVLGLCPNFANAVGGEGEPVFRVFGSNRYETSYKVAEMMADMDAEPFPAVIVASGTNFPDALAGSYLAAASGAPIILTDKAQGINEDWFRAYVAENATVYILGGSGVVSETIETQLEGYTVERLAGSNRYDTNLIILKKAIALGDSTQDILVCTGTNFADSLSASATGKAILLVNEILNEDQKAFLAESGCENIYILGGTGAVGSKIETELAAYGAVTRISGADRYATSVKIAETFFPDATGAVVAYAKNFPDGLSGGPLAYCANVPLILTASDNDSAAAEYAAQTHIHSGVVLGGTSLISDDTAKRIFGVDEIVPYDSWVECAHDYADATCTEPATCRICGATEGDPLGHDFVVIHKTDHYNLGSEIISACTRCKHIEKSVVGVIDFAIQDTLPDGNGKKVKVIFLGGQSNAAGCSLDEYLEKNVSAEKYAEYDNGYDNVYINYHISDRTNKSDGFVKCATRQGEWGTCFGPELGLAEKLSSMYPDDTFFIVKYAWSGTSLYNHWLSPSSDGDTGVLYGQFVKFAEQSIAYLESKNYDVEVEGMCWMQGESDSYPEENAINYKAHLSNFIQDIRNQFAPYASQDGIAFIDACIADNPMYWVYCDLVNQGKQEVAQESPMNALIDTNAQGLTCNLEPIGQPDIAHYDSLSMIKLGNLFAEEIARYLD